MLGTMPPGAVRRMEDWFGWTRNNYDKIGHFMQGFGPAIYTREIVSRTSPLRRGKWLGFISIAIPLAFSAVYEIIEWLASLSNPTDTEAFLNTGLHLDTQSDMFLARSVRWLRSFCLRK
jgi:putative membrane protein